MEKLPFLTSHLVEIGYILALSRYTGKTKTPFGAFFIDFEITKTYNLQQRRLHRTKINNSMTINIGPGINIGTGIFLGSDPAVVADNLTLRLTGASYPGSGTTWTDLAAPTSNDATLVNSPTYSAGNGGYFTFASASSQYATVSGTVLDPTNYTKSCWFWLNSYTDNNLISRDSGVNGHYMFFGGTSTLYAGHAGWTGFPTTFGSVTTFALNRWYQAVITFNTTDGMKIYVNGQLDSSYTAQKTATNTGLVNLASYAAGGNLLNGRMTEIACYDRSITASEVWQNFVATRSLFGV